MNSAKDVDALVAQWKQEGRSAQWIAWETAKACIGWPYVYADAGSYCTPSNRRAKARDDHPTIVTKCQVLSGSSSYCNGCKWFPNKERVREYDCRGFTRWCAKQAGVTIAGGGATSQWNTESNWSSKGTIDTMPQNQVVCLFVRNGAKMSHTGLGYGHETCECSSGVQYKTSIAAKWTHWAIPKGFTGDPPSPTTEKPTLRRGSKGPYVVEAQTKLQALGYDLGSAGVDGIYGSMTVKAVKAFQSDNGLKVDGVIGPATWAALDAAEPGEARYTATIRDLTETEAEAVKTAWPAAEIVRQ